MFILVLLIFLKNVKFVSCGTIHDMFGEGEKKKKKVGLRSVNDAWVVVEHRFDF